MKRVAILAAAAFAALAGPAAFAQSATIITGGPVILEGVATSKPIPGAVIAQSSVIAAPGTVAVMPGSVAVAPNTTVLGGPGAVVTTTPSSTVTIVRHYWNVPADINSRMDFQRWQRLL